MQASVRFRWFDALLLAGAAAASLIAVAVISLSPKQGTDGIAVVFAPWISAAETMTRAVEPGGRFVRFGTFDFIAVVEPDSEEYARRVWQSGALLVADPVALAACLKPFKANKS